MNRMNRDRLCLKCCALPRGYQWYGPIVASHATLVLAFIFMLSGCASHPATPSTRESDSSVARIPGVILAMRPASAGATLVLTALGAADAAGADDDRIEFILRAAPDRIISLVAANPLGLRVGEAVLLLGREHVRLARV